ncbi:alpha/beta hydrolase fold domain-containing protein [Spirillospora sp. NPDC047279]|uniref:alpha/beta hydrolase n=1 Tax=Spirillospora sp. NPDC047279 TaxID=3155478 RepID=UPI0033ED69D0
MTNSVITTGADTAEETRAFNARLATITAAEPKLSEIGPVEARRRREQGEGVFPAPVRLPEGTDETMRGVPVRIFRPADIRGVLLHAHGGGWTFGSAAGQDVRLWDLAESANLAVVSVGYRLAPENPHPAAAEDIENVARQLIATSATEFGTDRLVIAGESAGADDVSPCRRDDHVLGVQICVKQAVTGDGLQAPVLTLNSLGHPLGEGACWSRAKATRRRSRSGEPGE